MNSEFLGSDKITTLDEFLRWTQDLPPGDYLFRGVSNTQHKIEASAYRRLTEEYKNFKNFVEINEELIKDAQLQGLGIRDGRDLKDLEILAVLQHAGAATCLIDFTYSALIALWFACGNEPSDGKVDEPSDGKVDEPSDGKVVAVSSKLSEFTEIRPELLGEQIRSFLNEPEDGAPPKLYQWRPWQLNNRIGAQQSIFLFGYFEIDTDKECIIDGTSKKILRKQLQQSGNITEAILFPDLDGFARLHHHNVLYMPTSVLSTLSL